jgi:hypothetical protein
LDKAFVPWTTSHLLEDAWPAPSQESTENGVRQTVHALVILTNAILSCFLHSGRMDAAVLQNYHHLGTDLLYNIIV